MLESALSYGCEQDAPQRGWLACSPRASVIVVGLHANACDPAEIIGDLQQLVAPGGVDFEAFQQCLIPRMRFELSPTSTV